MCPLVGLGAIIDMVGYLKLVLNYRRFYFMFKVIFTYSSSIDSNIITHSFDYEHEENCYNFYSLSEEERFAILESELSSMVDDFGFLISYKIEN